MTFDNRFYGNISSPFDKYDKNEDLSDNTQPMGRNDYPNNNLDTKYYNNNPKDAVSASIEPIAVPEAEVYDQKWYEIYQTNTRQIQRRQEKIKSWYEYLKQETAQNTFTDLLNFKWEIDPYRLAAATYGSWALVLLAKKPKKVVWIPRDKALHILWSSALYTGLRWMWASPSQAAVLAWAIWIGKELSDKFLHTWNASIGDLVADAWWIALWALTDKFLPKNTSINYHNGRVWANYTYRFG